MTPSPILRLTQAVRAKWDQLSYDNQRTITSVTRHLLVLVSVVLILFPLFWMFSTALRDSSQMFTRPIPILPPDLTLQNYVELFQNTQFIDFYVNSIILSGGVVILTTVLATLGGYGLTRIDIPYKRTFARGILFGYMFPPILLAIPMFIIWRELSILNTYIGVIMAVTAISLPFSLWLMWKFFQTVPMSLEESAKMSGASQFRAFYEIALPIATPGSIAVAVYAYAVSWNAYTIPRVLLSDEALWPLTVGLDTFTRQQNVLWGQIMGASALAIIPAFLFVYFLQKYLLRGFRTVGVG